MNPSNKVLLVEDDQELAALVTEYLQTQEFEVVHVSRGDVAVERITSEPAPDVMLLDVNLPGMDGFSVCRAVRAKFRGVIIMLTARSEEVDEVVGLEVGADDYIVKPVRPRALLARLRMHLRRSDVEDSPPTKPITVGDLVINVANRTAVLAGKSLDLTTAEFELLAILAQNAGTPVSRNQIYQALLGIRYDGVDRSIDLRVSRLRRKLGDDPTKPQRVKSIRGIGYLMPQD